MMLWQHIKSIKNYVYNLSQSFTNLSLIFHQFTLIIKKISYFFYLNDIRKKLATTTTTDMSKIKTNYFIIIDQIIKNNQFFINIIDQITLIPRKRSHP